MNIILLSIHYYQLTNNEILFEFINYLLLLNNYNDINLLISINDKNNIGMIEEILRCRKNGIKLPSTLIEIMILIYDKNKPMFKKYFEIYGIKDLEIYKCEIYNKIINL